MTHFWPPSVESALWSYDRLSFFRLALYRIALHYVVKHWSWSMHIDRITSVDWRQRPLLNERENAKQRLDRRLSVDGRETTTVTETWETERDAHKYFDTGNQATSAAHESATLTTYSSASITHSPFLLIHLLKTISLTIVCNCFAVIGRIVVER